MTLTASPEGQCKVCDRAFLRFRTTQAVCGPTCARKSVKADKKAEKEDTRARRLAIKPRSKWLAEAQQAFNAWVRARDAAEPCISCREHRESNDAGHFYTVGARPELRFHPDNVHKQCVVCNRHQHGNLLAYAKHLPDKIGAEAFEKLQSPHPPMHYSVDDLRIIKHTYRAKTRALQVSQPA